MTNFKSRGLNFARSGLARALAISLALHVVLLVQAAPETPGLWSSRGPAQGGNFLEASLRGMMKQPAAAPALSKNFPMTGSPTPPARPVPEALQPQRPASPDLAPEIAGPVETGTAADRRLSGRESGAPPNSTGMTAPSAEDGLDAQGLRQYRLSLAVASRRFKHYPRQALEQGWNGTAEVSVALAADGVPQAVRLLSSSGHDVLDAVALEMIGNAARNTAVPASLRGRPFSVPLPVEFRRDSD